MRTFMKHYQNKGFSVRIEHYPFQQLSLCFTQPIARKHVINFVNTQSKLLTLLVKLVISLIVLYFYEC